MTSSLRNRHGREGYIKGKKKDDSLRQLFVCVNVGLLDSRFFFSPFFSYSEQWTAFSFIISFVSSHTDLPRHGDKPTSKLHHTGGERITRKGEKWKKKERDNRQGGSQPGHCHALNILFVCSGHF